MSSEVSNPTPDMVERVAEAIAAAYGAEVQREDYQAASAAIAALQLTEEVAFRHHFPNGRSILLTDLTDIEAARKVAAKAGTSFTEERRVVSPWVGAGEKQ